MTARATPTSPPPAVPGRELAAWPRRGTCASCGEEILKAKLHLRARPRVLELAEVIPAYPCGKCEGRGRVGPRQALQECPRCYGTRELGEIVYPDEQLVAIDPYGNARAITVEQRRRGEALYRPHICH